MRNENGVRRAADMIGLLTRAPRTVSELMGLTGMGEESVRKWLKALRDEGVVVQAGTREEWSDAAKRFYFNDVFVWYRRHE